MTAAMQALSQKSGPKVLRVGLVREGHVTEERVIEERTHVTVGSNEKNTFVINVSGMSAFRLFELVGSRKSGEYCLNFTDAMTGRVALQGGVVELGALKLSARRGSRGEFKVPLAEDSRGKIVIGNSTFLFQFVAPPPRRPKPMLPVSVRSGMSSQVDWRFTMIASFSFLFHFGAVGLLYSDWMDPVINEDVIIASLIDSVKNIPPPPPIETPDVPEENTQGTTETATEAKSSGSGKSGGGKGAGKGGSLSASEFAGLSNALDQLNIATLGALTNTGSATAGVLGSGEVSMGALEAAAASGAGVGFAGGGGLNLGGGGGGAIRPGAAGGGLASIGQTGGGGPATAGSVTKVEGPKPVVGASASVAGGAVGNASSVVSRMQGRFRRCYEAGLNENPGMTGRVDVTASIGPNGEVLSASARPGGTISSAVAQCIGSVVQGATFDPPEGGAATVNIPVILTQQK